MANDLDKQIRIKIGGVITAAYATAIVYPWNVLSHRLDEWPGLFRMSAGGTHGWIIKRSAAGNEWKQLSGLRDRRKWTYDVWGFYGFRSGKTSDNSDNEFGEIWDTVYEAIKAKPTLDFEGTVEWHELLQLVNMTTIRTGEETLHFAQGRLAVHLCC